MINNVIRLKIIEKISTMVMKQLSEFSLRLFYLILLNIESLKTFKH